MSTAPRDRDFLTKLVGPAPPKCEEPCPTCKGTSFDIKLCLGHEQINNAGRYMAICQNPECKRFNFEHRKPAHWLTDTMASDQMKKYIKHRAESTPTTKKASDFGTPSPKKTQAPLTQEAKEKNRRENLAKINEALKPAAKPKARSGQVEFAPPSDEEDGVFRPYSTPNGTIKFVEVDKSIGSTGSFMVPSSRLTSSWAPTASPSSVSSAPPSSNAGKMEVVVYFYYSECDTPLRQVAYIDPCTPDAAWVHWDRDFQFTLEASGIFPRTIFHLWRPLTQKWSTMFRDGMTLVGANEFLIIKTRNLEKDLLGLDILKSALAHAVYMPRAPPADSIAHYYDFVPEYMRRSAMVPYNSGASSAAATIASSSKTTLEDMPAPSAFSRVRKRKIESSKGKACAISTDDEDADAVETLTPPVKKFKAETADIITISD